MKTILTIIFGLNILLCVHSNNVGVIDENDILILNEVNYSIIDKIRELIEKFIETIKNEFNQILVKLKETLAKTYARIVAIYEQARSKLKAVTFKAELLIKTLKRKGGIYEECAKNVEPELNDLKNKTIERLNKCTNDYIQSLKNYETEILENITKIEEQIDELRLAIVTCIHVNPITTAKCLIDRLNEYKTKIGDILISVRDAAKNAVYRGLEAIDGVQNCNRNAIGDAVIETEGINKRLDKCLAVTTTTAATTTTTMATTTTSTTTITTPTTTEETTSEEAVTEEETTTEEPTSEE